MPGLARPIRYLGILLLIAGCGAPPEGVEGLEPLGDFQLGHNIVVSRSPTMGPLSRQVSDAEWEEAMKAAVTRQFGAFEGGKLYHVAIKIQGYIVAVPGIPLVAAPKSTLIITANVWDDARGVKLSPEAHPITVMESFSGENLVSSGLTKSKEEQVRELSENAVGEVLEWMRKHPEWFDGSSANTENADDAAVADALASAT
jgi:hypothetical protein